MRKSQQRKDGIILWGHGDKLENMVVGRQNIAGGGRQLWYNGMPNITRYAFKNKRYKNAHKEVSLEDITEDQIRDDGHLGTGIMVQWRKRDAFWEIRI